MSSENVPGPHEREMSAVIYNLKEQRVLEKCLQTLCLEQTYALKLLDMNNREMKMQYKKLKDKVSKTRSFLPIEDISKFRELDMKGKLKSTGDTIALSSAGKIAEAARRLNINSDQFKNKRCIQSALPRICVHTDDAITRSKSAETIQRSKSVIGLLHEQSHEGISSRREKPCSVQFNSMFTQQNGQLSNPNGSFFSAEKAKISDLHMTEKSMAISENEVITVPGETGGYRVFAGYAHSHSPFSSHVTAVKDAREGLRTAPAPCNYTRRLSQVSSYSIDSNLGENIFEERRFQLLEEEGHRAAALEEKTRLFLQDIEAYLRLKPRIQSSISVIDNSLQESSSGKAISSSSKGHSRFHKFHNRNAFSKHNDRPPRFQEKQYKEHALSLWTGLNKCRYLRLPDDKLDISGVNTLAKDQLQLFEALREAECAPLREAWEM